MPGHLSAFDLFLDFDKILHAITDPMHALLEGILPFYIWKVLVLGRYDCHKLGHQHSKCPTQTCATVPKVNQLETELTAGDTTSAYLMLAQTIPSADDGASDTTYALFHPLLSISVPVPADDSLPAPSPKFLLDTGVSMTFVDPKLAVRLGWDVRKGTVWMSFSLGRHMYSINGVAMDLHGTYDSILGLNFFA
ncbi:hypothetical protein C356_06868 [Cryptococcus neoformans c45]|nr:hypothetical protein C356_06868 [Cryptococcus neoformans var. grubii c45]